METNSTLYIQKLIDDASEKGCEAVVPGGVYVCGTIFLRDNLTLRLEKGAVIMGSVNPEDYSENVDIFYDGCGLPRGKALIYADGIKNVRIYGGGIINGRGAQHKYDGRPFLVRIKNCSDIELDGISLQDGAAWNLHIMDCERVRINSLLIKSHVNHNNDGIDIDASRDVTVSDCYVDTGDDAVCLKATVNKPCRNITVKGCTLSSSAAAIKMGTESVGDFENITISDINVYDTYGCAVKIVPVDGANVRNVNIENIKVENTVGPVFIANGERMRGYHGQPPRTVPGQIDGVNIKGIYGNCINPKNKDTLSCICVSGTVKNPVKNINLSDIHLEMPGGAAEYIPFDIPEMGDRYPEYYNFGILPSWGIYTRHTENLTTSDIALELGATDVRPEVRNDK